MNILEAIKSRRSHFTKEFAGGSIAKEKVMLLLEMAHWAPSHSLTLPWRFKVYSGQARISIVQKMAEVYKSETPVEKFKQEKLDKIWNYPEQVSDIVAIIMKRDAQKRIPQIEEVCAVACAVQNIYLALTTFDDIGGYWTTGNGTYSPAMKSFLGLEEDDVLMGFFFLGNLKAKRTISNREPFENHVEWVD